MAVKQTKNKHSPLAHIRSSITYVAHHKHTGKRLAHHHTSHGAMLLILVLAGTVLFFSLATLKVAGMTGSGQVSISATVLATPPTTGAIISTPAKKTKFSNALAEVKGSCPTGTIVAVYKNGSSAGSTVCTEDENFQLTVQLSLGNNTLQAQNYNQTNQPGPVTEQVEVAYDPADTAPLIVALPNAAGDITNDPSIPLVATSKPSDNPCYEGSTPPSSNELVLVVSCVTRNVFVGDKLELPVTLLGGIGPYALTVDWGDASKPETHSFASAGKYTLSYVYTLPQVKSISLHLADATGKTYQTETVIDINNRATGSSDPFSEMKNAASSSWIEASIPIYWGVVAVFFGFWVGDLFQRFFGSR